MPGQEFILSSKPTIASAASAAASAVPCAEVAPSGVPTMPQASAGASSAVDATLPSAPADASACKQTADENNLPAASSAVSPCAKAKVKTACVSTSSNQKAKPRTKRTVKRLKTLKTGTDKVSYRPEFCRQLLAFFDVPPFKVTEVQKKDGSITLLESASELPTFAAFARTLGVTQAVLQDWEDAHPAFAEAAKKARDLQGDILIQNSLRGNYSASFAVFTAKNLLGWTDGKDDGKKPLGTVIVRWEKE